MRAGNDAFLDPDGRGVPRHTLVPVYAEALFQICHEYSSLGDPLRLTLSDIRFFYNGIRETLKRATKPR